MISISVTVRIPQQLEFERLFPLVNVHRATLVDGLTSGESTVGTQKSSVKSHFRTGGEPWMESDATTPLNLPTGVAMGGVPARKRQRSECGC